MCGKREETLATEVLRYLDDQTSAGSRSVRQGVDNSVRWTQAASRGAGKDGPDRARL